MAMHLRQVEAENQSQALAEAGPFSPAFPDFPRSVAYPKETWSKKGQNMAIEWLSHVLLVIFLTPGGDMALNLAGWWWLSGGKNHRKRWEWQRAKIFHSLGSIGSIIIQMGFLGTQFSHLQVGKAPRKVNVMVCL